MARRPTVGDQLGRFELKRHLGKGGVGDVFLARDTTLNVEVAIKVLQLKRDNEASLTRFQREVLLARKIAHPGICRLFDLHEQDGLHFISMEYVPGETLESLLQRKGILPPERLVPLFSSLCRALEAAHRAGVIHRDLKPTNVILRDRVQATVLDFGFSTVTDATRLTATGQAVGTLSYVAPETLDEAEPTALVDVYALGVILYRCLTGRLPFTGENLLATARAILDGNLVPPRYFNPAVTEERESVVLRTLARVPTERFQSAKELRRAFERAYTGTARPTIDDTSSGAFWDGDVDRAVSETLNDPTSSRLIQTRIRDTTILFSDIVGITSFFDEYGDVAGRKKISAHNRLLFPVIGRHSGEVIKTIGDAIMASFETGTDAVGAAVAMQEALQAHNVSEQSQDHRILVRIGIHTGKAIVEDRDVFGDTVNVAARVCSKADGRQILMTPPTLAALRPGAYTTRRFGAVSLKGKREDVELFEVAWGPSMTDPHPNRRASRRITDLPRKRRPTRRPADVVEPPRSEAKTDEYDALPPNPHGAGGGEPPTVEVERVELPSTGHTETNAGHRKPRSRDVAADFLGDKTKPDQPQARQSKEAPDEDFAGAKTVPQGIEKPPDFSASTEVYPPAQPVAGLSHVDQVSHPNEGVEDDENS